MGWKRLLNLEAKTENPYSGMSKAELAVQLNKIHAENLNLHMELTKEHERRNACVRIIGSLYFAFFNIVYMYSNVCSEYKEKNRPVSTMWLASRIVDIFEALFEQHDIKEMDIGPDRSVLNNLVIISGMKLQKGSPISNYLGKEYTEGVSNETEESAEQLEKEA